MVNCRARVIDNRWSGSSLEHASIPSSVCWCAHYPDPFVLHDPPIGEDCDIGIARQFKCDVLHAAIGKRVPLGELEH